MKNKNKYSVMILAALLSTLIFESCHPLKEMSRIPVYKGETHKTSTATGYDGNKKTIVIVANTNGTELFDLMAPFYIFNATEQANVFIVAEKRKPIALLKGTFIMPQFTFSEMDSLNIHPDVIVLPAMINTFKDPNSITQRWIKANYTGMNKVLSICVGSLAGAATGIYDGKLLTTHASNFEMSKAYFKKPNWVQNTTVTKDGNLYSTAGVSNAVEGSLTVINELFGNETLQKVMTDIHYPHSSIKTTHKSLPVKTKNKFTIANKLLFKKNLRMGVLLQNGINEFELSGLMDCYNRTIPYYNESVTIDGLPITSKYGLTFIPSAKMDGLKLDELHVLVPENYLQSETEKSGLKSKTMIVQHSFPGNEFIIDYCLERISKQYGSKFENITKLLLDYN